MDFYAALTGKAKEVKVAGAVAATTTTTATEEASAPASVERTITPSEEVFFISVRCHDGRRLKLQSNTMMMDSVFIQEKCVELAGHDIDFFEVHKKNIRNLITTYVSMYYRKAFVRPERKFSKHLKWIMNFEYRGEYDEHSHEHYFDVLTGFPKDKFEDVCFGLSYSMDPCPKKVVRVDLPFSYEAVQTFFRFSSSILFDWINFMFGESLNLQRYTNDEYINSFGHVYSDLLLYNNRSVDEFSSADFTEILSIARYLRCDEMLINRLEFFVASRRS